MEKIVVIGGSGLIGSRVVKSLVASGRNAVAASPRTGVNAQTGQGLAKALEGATILVDVSNAPSWEDTAVMEFFQQSTRNLLEAEAAAGVKHHVALSVVGCDRLQQSGYMRAKVAQEKLIEGGGVPYTIVRATQFCEFIEYFVNTIDPKASGGTVRVPDALMQPISADDVAAGVVTAVEGAPVNGTYDISGPEALPMAEIANRSLKARGDSRKAIADPSIDYFGAKLESNTLIPIGGNERLAPTSFKDWLQAAKST